MPPHVARQYLHETFELPLITLSSAGHDRLLDLVAAEGVTGGAIYDAVVAATAGEAGAMLVTLDRRAIPTYQLLQIDYELLT